MVLGGAKGSKSVAEIMHLAAEARVVALQTELRNARADLRVCALAVARERAAKTRAVLKAKELEQTKAAKVGVQKTVEKAGAKASKRVVAEKAGRPKDVPAPVGEPRRRGRPLATPGVCNQCKRLAAGEPGGHDHAWFCPKAKYARV